MLLAQCNNTPLCKTCKINTNGTNERPAKQTPTAQTKGFKGKEIMQNRTKAQMKGFKGIEITNSRTK